MEDQLAGLNPSAYAPYGDPREYITSWTDKIWISRGLGHLRDHYAPGVKVHTAYGETYGYDHVMRNSIQKMVAFPNRGGGHDDVIWERRGDNGFVSAHRVLNNATHLGPWTYGPPRERTGSTGAWRTAWFRTTRSSRNGSSATSSRFCRISASTPSSSPVSF
jgi:hypothetical protein